MSDPDTTQTTTATDTAPAPQSSAPSAPSASPSSPASTPSAPASGNDRPTGPGIPGSKSPGRPVPGKPAAPLTTPIPETSKPPAPPALSLEEVQKALKITSAEDLKRFQNRDQLYGRQTNELAQARQKLAAFEKAQAEQRKSAEAQKLKPWKKAHPEHTKWQGTHTKVQENNRRVGELAAMAKDLPPEHQQAWIDQQTQRIRNELTPEDTQSWNDFVDDRKADDMRWHTDREGVLDEHFERMFDARMQRYQEDQQAKTDVQRDLESPELKQFMADPENKEQFDTALTGMSEDPWTYATHMVKMTQQNEALWAEVERLKSQNGTVNNQLQLQQTQAQLDARKAKASITRDVRQPKGNAFMLAREEAQKLGIDTQPTNPAWRKLLEKHTAAVANSK